MNYTHIYQRVFKRDVKRVIFRAAVANKLSIEIFEIFTRIFTLKHILLVYFKKNKVNYFQCWSIVGIFSHDYQLVPLFFCDVSQT